jgi:MFS family permease
MLRLIRHRRILGILAMTQIVSWGSIYYAFGVLAPEIQRELGWRSEFIYGAYSWSLLVAGLMATPVGILLDRIGGRSIMGVGSFAAGTGLMLLSAAKSLPVYFMAWTMLGGAMALTLYEAAFATINREMIEDSRKAISTLTLFGGFASTVFWPLTLHMNNHVGWRETYFIYGVVQLALCLPAHLLLPSNRSVSASRRTTSDGTKNYTLKEALRHAAFWKLAFAFAMNAFVFAALSVHLIPILNRFGHPMATVIVFVALIGPMQVVGRFGEMAFASRIQPQAVGKLVFALVPAALLALLLLGTQQWMAAGFCILYGLSNGIMTIVRGTVPQEMFGRENYGAISGALAGPSLVAKAAGPMVTAALLQMTGDWHIALYVLLGFTVASLVCYLAAMETDGKKFRTLPWYFGGARNAAQLNHSRLPTD